MIEVIHGKSEGIGKNYPAANYANENRAASRRDFRRDDRRNIGRLISGQRSAFLDDWSRAIEPSAAATPSKKNERAKKKIVSPQLRDFRRAGSTG